MDKRLRKIQLILRDPLGIEFDKIFQTWLNNTEDLELTESLYEIKRKIRKKWNINFYIPSSTQAGITDYWMVAGKDYQAVEVGHRPLWLFNRLADGSYADVTGVHALFDRDYLVYCEPHKIPILIDPSVITLNDARKIKKEVWSIVERKIRESQGTGQGGWLPKAPICDPPELAKVLRCHGKTFEKYLRWFDLKMAGLPFRLIALVEKSFRDPLKRAKKFEEIIASGKKPLIGQKVKGESNVRNGFNIIYSSIFRKDTPSKEKMINTIGKYDCPSHGTECGTDCDYLKSWMENFNRSVKDSYQREPLPRTFPQN